METTDHTKNKYAVNCPRQWCLKPQPLNLTACYEEQKNALSLVVFLFLRLSPLKVSDDQISVYISQTTQVNTKFKTHMALCDKLITPSPTLKLNKCSHCCVITLEFSFAIHTRAWLVSNLFWIRKSFKGEFQVFFYQPGPYF